MYAGEVVLSKKSAEEALQSLAGLGITHRIPYEIIGGSIKREAWDGASALELELGAINNDSLSSLLGIILRIKRQASKQNCTTGLGVVSVYDRLEDIYQRMKERHGEKITLMGEIGPSRDIEMHHILEQSAGNETLKIIDISHICLN